VPGLLFLAGCLEISATLWDSYSTDQNMLHFPPFRTHHIGGKENERFIEMDTHLGAVRDFVLYRCAKI
jgi:hypothetical protein